MKMNNDQEHTISAGEPKADGVTAPRCANPTDVNPGGEAITIITAEPMKPPRPPRMRNSTLKKDKEHYERTLQNPAIRMNEHGQTPFDSSASPSEGGHETYPYWKPMNTNTSNPGTKPTANHVVDKLPPIPHPEEPFTGRDTKVIPDRGKSFRQS